MTLLPASCPLLLSALAAVPVVAALMDDVIFPAGAEEFPEEALFPPPLPEGPDALPDPLLMPLPMDPMLLLLDMDPLLFAIAII